MQDGHYGYTVTSVKNGKSIFLPAAGGRDGTSLDNAGSDGVYWSSSLGENTNDTWCCYFNSSYLDADVYSSRISGLSVRPVAEK